MEFMTASQEAVENLGKIANWFQPTCAIIIKLILSAIGRLFYRIERVERVTFDNFNITFSFARDLVIISAGSIKQLLKNLVNFENAILLITEE